MIQESKLRIVIESQHALRDAQAMRRELESLDKTGQFATKSMDQMSVAIRQLAGYAAGLATVSAAINKVDAYTGMQNRLKLVTESQEQLNQAMGDTFAIAQKTASSWDSTAMVYQRFADNADRLGISMKQTAALTETVSKAISISGGSAASAEAALMQFGQALASDILRGEEFNSIAEQAPGLLKAIAMGMDTNVGSLRAMAAEGKITGDELVKALSKAKPYIDDLFNKTDFTIAQSLTQLSNEVTKFVGAAGAGSGAAAGLSAAISGLADNLGTIANIAVVGGVAMLTKTIVTQTIATHGAIAASVTRRNSLLSELEAQATLTATEARRTASIAQYTQMQLADAKATAARMTGIQRLAYVQATVIPLEAKATQATAAHTAATNADTLAQEINNKARSRATMLLGMVGGPIGAITLGVAGLAAGYMYLKSRTAEVNAKLEEQGKVAEKTKEELLALKGVQLDVTKDDLATSFKAQNEELHKLNLAFNGFIRTVKNANEGNQEVKEISDQVHKGLMSQADAIERLNKLKLLTPEQKSQGLDLINSYDEAREKAQKNAEAQKVLGVEVKLAGNAAQNASPKIAGNTKELKENESAAQKAAKAQKGYFDSLNQDVLSANERLAYMNLGFSKEIIDQINKLQEAKQKALGDGVTAIVTTEEIKQIVQAQNALDAVKDKEDEITQAKRQQNKEAEKSAKLAEKQAVIMAGTNEQTKNMLKVYQAFRNAGVDDVKARVLTAQVGREGDFLNKNLFGSHTDAANRKTNSGMISWQGSRSKSLTQYLQGQGVLDKKGNIEQTQEALNAQAKFFIQEIMTEKRYSSSKNALLGDSSSYRELEKVFGKNAIAWDYNGKNIGSDKAAKNLARQDNYYNSLNKILGGDPENALSSIKDLAKYDDEAYKARKDLLDRIEQLQSQYDTEAVARSKARDEEILQATILSQNDLIPKIKERYDAEDKLAKLQQEFDVEGHKWTEERKLQYTYDTNVLRLTAEGRFSEDQKKIFEKALKEQYEQEKAFVVLARETRIFQYREALMAEAELVRERYRIEMLELSKIVDIEERRIAMQAKTTAFIRGSLAPVGTPLVESNKGKSNTQLLQEETGRELLAMQNRYRAAQVAAKENADELLRIERDYLAAKEQLHAEHDIKLVDARQADFENQLQVYSQIAGLTAQTFDQMTSMLRDSVGESNALYKTMFLAGRAASIAQAIVNTEEGATKALAQGGAYGSILAGVVRATGYASVGMIAAQTIAGFATGGKIRGAGTPTSDSIPILASDREYMVRAYAAEKLGTPTMDYINKYGELPQNTHRVGMGAVNAINSGGSGGKAVIQPKVVINNYSSEKVETSTNQDGELMVTIGKILDQKIDSGVDRGIQRNLRQGYPLANAIKGR
ncbi:tape measure protein [Acinetobacter variabilis]|uniref:tape measure protein n=1 Tax=Acinetobacter variabilis TaxID=70346 RepID=UPI0028A03392|nr:tape measure protein [Acinetobacter variabilis]